MPPKVWSLGVLMRMIVMALFGIVAACSGYVRFWGKGPIGLWVDVVFLVSMGGFIALALGALLVVMRRFTADDRDGPEA